jgi:hypothetical protein
MQATKCALCGHVRPAAVLLATALVLGTLLAGSAAASPAYSAASAQPRPIPWTGWHGQPIQRPHKPVDEKALGRDASYPAGWSAGAVRFGSGYNRPHGSRRVREVQWRLTDLGYHTGPIDGLYGPLTRSAVQWFQIKHGLRPTGVVAATTLLTLRNPKAFAHPGSGGARAKQRGAPTGPRPGAVPNGQLAPAQAPTSAKPAAESPHWLIPVVIAVLAVGLLALACMALLRRWPARRWRNALLPPALTANMAQFRRPVDDGPALGYVRSNDVEGAMAHTAAIMDACEQQGWELERLIRDSNPNTKSRVAQPGLSYALEQLRQGNATRLVVHELDQLALSGTELRMMLGWFLRTGIALTALDVALDTSTEEGRNAAAEILTEEGRRESPFGSGRTPASAYARREEARTRS